MHRVEKQLHKTFDEKQKLTKNDEAAWHEFFQIVKIHIIIRGEVYSIADLRKIYNEIRSEIKRNKIYQVPLETLISDKYYKICFMKKMC